MGALLKSLLFFVYLLCFLSFCAIWRLCDSSLWSMLLGDKISPKPFCANVLESMTGGFWKVKEPLNESLQLQLDNMFLEYWKRRGIPTQRWRADGHCGYYSFQERVPGSRWPRVGSWCDPRGEKPCCSDFTRGTCSNMTENCTCPSCVDTRLYKHAELSEWIVGDTECKWKTFIGEKACEVIGKSPYSDLYFVGDSFVRNMYSALLLVLSSDFERGAWRAEMNDQQRNICIGAGFFLYEECRYVTLSFDDLLHKRQRLCRGQAFSFNATFQFWPNYKTANKMLSLTRSLLGKRGSLVILGVGYHDGSHWDGVMKHFIEPWLAIMHEFYNGTGTPQNERWPRMIFVMPMSQGLLKSPDQFFLQNNERIAAFCNKMKKLLREVDIPVLDFRNMTNNVHSFDGTHYGLAVNSMKVQTLLNYFYSLSLQADVISL